LYIELSEKIGLQEKLAIITFGKDTGVKCSFTTNYSLLKRVVLALKADGGTPMGEGLAYALKEITDNGTIFKVGSTLILPRIILLTDGEPDNKTEAIQIAQSLGTLRFPITAMGVSGCNVNVMKSIAEKSGGVFLMITQIDRLVEQFLNQLFLLLFIIEMQNQLENLFDNLVIRSYLEDRQGRTVSDEEVELFKLFLQAIVVTEEQENRPQPRPKVNKPIKDTNNQIIKMKVRSADVVFSNNFDVNLYWTVGELINRIEQTLRTEKIQNLQIGYSQCDKMRRVREYHPDPGDTITITFQVHGGK